MHEIRVNIMTKQHSMLFLLMLSVLSINNLVFGEKSVESEDVIIYFSVSKQGGAIIRGGAIFGGNTVPLFYYAH